MVKPSSCEAELIKKILKATTKLEAFRKIHPDTCPVNDPLVPGECTCGVNEHNATIDSIISDLVHN